MPSGRGRPEESNASCGEGDKSLQGIGFPSPLSCRLTFILRSKRVHGRASGSSPCPRGGGPGRRGSAGRGERRGDGSRTPLPHPLPAARGEGKQLAQAELCPAFVREVGCPLRGARANCWLRRCFAAILCVGVRLTGPHRDSPSLGEDDGFADGSIVFLLVVSRRVLVSRRGLVMARRWRGRSGLRRPSRWAAGDRPAARSG